MSITDKHFKETLNPGETIVNTVNNLCDKFYNQGLEHAIELVKIKQDSEDSVTNVCEQIISTLENLKSKKDESNPA